MYCFVVSLVQACFSPSALIRSARFTLSVDWRLLDSTRVQIGAMRPRPPFRTFGPKQWVQSGAGSKGGLSAGRSAGAGDLPGQFSRERLSSKIRTLPCQGPAS